MKRGSGFMECRAGIKKLGVILSDVFKVVRRTAVLHQCGPGESQITRKDGATNEEVGAPDYEVASC